MNVTVTVVIPKEASPEVRTLALRKVDELRDEGYDILVDTAGDDNHPGNHEFSVKCRMCGVPGQVVIHVLGHDERLTVTRGQ